MPLNTKKKSDDMQIDRLIQIVFLLLRHENITAKQLAEELCVSTRTIYRDINILSVAGIPITSQKGFGGGLSLLQGFSLDKYYFIQEVRSVFLRAIKNDRWDSVIKAVNESEALLKATLAMDEKAVEQMIQAIEKAGTTAWNPAVTK